MNDFHEVKFDGDTFDVVKCKVLESVQTYPAAQCHNPPQAEQPDLMEITQANCPKHQVQFRLCHFFTL